MPEHTTPDTSTRTALASATSPAVSVTRDATAAATPSETALAVAPVARTVEAPGPADAALAMLDTLAVKGRAPKTGYSRAQFGPSWTDDVDVESGHNGCDTRNDILRRDLTDVTLNAGTHGCTVLTGTLADPYTDTSISFARGETTSSAVQIDHVVALSDAWQKGAQQISTQQRQALANDPINLQATDGPTNEQKGDGDAATWLPPNTAYRCTYVSRQIDVKAAYSLWVTPAEKEAMTRVLTGCGGTAPDTTPSTSSPVPTTTSRTSTPPYTPPPTTKRYAPTQTPPVADNGGSSVYYANCTAARAAGAAPIYAGQPGYRSALDHDDDGIACET